MSEKKVLSINPDLFSFTNNNTKKKRDKLKQNKINMKPEKKSSLNDTMKKRSILRMIRQHQNEKYEKILDEKKKEITNTLNTENVFKNDFKQAEEYLTHLSKETHSRSQNKHNYTIKQPVHNYQENIRLQPIHNDIEQIHTSTPYNVIADSNNIQPPSYGCLKNGSLPTYRSYMNQTKKNLPDYNNRMNVNSSITNEKNENIVKNMLEKQSINLQFLDRKQNNISFQDEILFVQRI